MDKIISRLLYPVISRCFISFPFTTWLHFCVCVCFISLYYLTFSGACRALHSLGCWWLTMPLPCGLQTHCGCWFRRRESVLCRIRTDGVDRLRWTGPDASDTMRDSNRTQKDILESKGSGWLGLGGEINRTARRWMSHTGLFVGFVAISARSSTSPSCCVMQVR
jgi:hypothetical protein